MSRNLIILIVLLVILVAAAVALYFLGRRTQKKQAEQQAQIEANKQTVSLMVIDKKRLRLKESGLPQAVIDQAPKLLRRSKLPIVKVKVGPQFMNLVCDEKIFDELPTKREIKAQVSGVYIVGYKGVRGAKTPEPPVKKSRWKKFVEKLQEKAGAKPV